MADDEIAVIVGATGAVGGAILREVTAQGVPAAALHGSTISLDGGRLGGIF